jgi:hypothetical protein
MGTIAETEPTSARRFNARAVLAGGATTAALIAAALVVFLSLATYVAFNGLPLGGGETGADDRAVTIATGPPVAGAPESAAAATPAAPAAVAATPAAPTAVGPIVLPRSGGGEAPAGGGGVIAPAAPGEVPLVVDTGAPAATGPQAQRGILGGTVEDLENTTDKVVDLPLSDLTGGLTRPVDEVARQALNGLGGNLLGNPELGNQLQGTVNTLTDGLLGPGGLTDQLLGPSR